MSEKPSTARNLNRSVSFQRAAAEKLATTPTCEACASAHAVEVHLPGPLGCFAEVETYDQDKLLACCRECHNAQPGGVHARRDACPRPPEAYPGQYRWP